MTPLVLLLLVVQAGLLFWAAFHLSDIYLHPKKAGPLLWALATLAGSLAIAKSTAEEDRHRALCSPGDCLVLALSVACVRVLAVSKEQEQLALEYAENRRRAAASAAAAREAREAEQVRTAAAALETHLAAAPAKPARPALPPRHLTPSKLGGGAPSPRFRPSPRK